jgi:hypothetical protein
LKKLIAATLLTIYLFNLAGHLALYQYFTFLSDKLFNEQASLGRYNVNDLTEVQIPVDMPGITDWNGYISVSGQIKFENTSYNYVKMKVTRHVLYLMCIPNYDTTRLSGDNILEAKNIKDIPVSKKDHVPYGKSTLIGKFNIASVQFTFVSPIKIGALNAMHIVQPVFSHTSEVPEQPPRLSC